MVAMVIVHSKNYLVAVYNRRIIPTGIVCIYVLRFIGVWPFKNNRLTHSHPVEQNWEESYCEWRKNSADADEWICVFGLKESS